MIKTYKANTYVSINVILKSKENLHISFAPNSDGSSCFTTDNEDIQNGIERHYNFNNLFRLESTDDIPKAEKVKVYEEDTSTTDDIPKAESKSTQTDITVTDISAAKDYLADTFGLSRTSLRSRKQIIDSAAERGIIFHGID